MTELVERYIYQVGRFLPQKERADIQAELRSQIQDQLEDRFKGTPTQSDVVAVLAELGDPRQIAASYSGEQYLVGPALYPIMMMVLRRGWVMVPPIVVFVNVFAALVSDESNNLVGLLIQSTLSAVQATFLFTAIVVLLFAILQHSGEDLDELTGQEKVFDPLNLPEVNDPADVDRLEVAFSIAFGTFSLLVLLYFLRVGGLTLRFNLSDPGEVIPVPIPWLILLIIAVIGTIILQLLALLRNRWSVTMWLAQTILEVFSAISLYFVLWIPVFERIIAAVPSLANGQFIDRVPQIIVVFSVIVTLAGNGNKLVKMIGHRNSANPASSIKANG